MATRRGRSASRASRTVRASTGRSCHRRACFARGDPLKQEGARARALLTFAACLAWPGACRSRRPSSRAWPRCAGSSTPHPGLRAAVRSTCWSATRFRAWGHLPRRHDDDQHAMLLSKSRDSLVAHELATTCSATRRRCAARPRSSRRGSRSCASWTLTPSRGDPHTRRADGSRRAPARLRPSAQFPSRGGRARDSGARGHRPPCEEIADLLARFPAHRSWTAALECAGPSLTLTPRRVRVIRLS